jgi:hypothetical protein
LAGNEDCGQMSAWYIFSSLGFYPMSPGKPEYELGRPMFQAATIYLENGKTIQMKAPKNSAKNKYVQSAKWNGVELNNTLSHLEIMKGGVLEFEMGNTPPAREKSVQNFEVQWPQKWTPAPYIVNEERVFEDQMKLGLDVLRLDTNDLQFIFYQLDSLSDWQTYERQIFLKNTTDLQFRAQRRTPKGSIGNGPIIQALLSKRNKELTLQLHSPFENQYAASGENALIDGVRGGIDYRTGDWQGFWDKDVQATITFENPKKVQSFGVSLLQDQAAWIFFPNSWTVEISENGTDFKKISTESIANAMLNTGKREQREVWMDLKTETNIHSIRFTLHHVETLPNWHLNAGQPSWIFVDEVLLK